MKHLSMTNTSNFLILKYLTYVLEQVNPMPQQGSIKTVDSSSMPQQGHSKTAQQGSASSMPQQGHGRTTQQGSASSVLQHGHVKVQGP